MRRRSAASASPARICAFSFAKSFCRAAFHSCCETTGGVLIEIGPVPCSLSLSLIVAISILLCFLKHSQTTRFEKFSELGDAHRQNSSRRSGCGHDYGCAFDACWAHIPSSQFFSSLKTALIAPDVFREYALHHSPACR